MAKYFIQDTTINNMANAVRNISGTTESMLPSEMIETLNTESENFNINLTNQSDIISQISTLVATKANPQGGTNTNDATATAGDILSGKTAYVKGEKVTGAIATKTSSDLTASGATVTVPAGYYATNASKSVASGTAKTPTTTITKTPTISVSSSGLITASVSGTQNVTPTVNAGYVSNGTAGTVTVSGSATKQLTTKAAATYTPGTSNQTIASGTYLTGTQTIKGDANLKAENIKSGVSIFGVSGTNSGAEDLDTELTTQENLISQLSTILDSKASGGSGGGSVETCTVIINNPLTIHWFYSYTAYENSKIIGKTNIDATGAGAGGNSLILDNVVCGSVVTIMETSGVNMYYSSSDDNTTQFLGSYAPSGSIAFTAPTSSNVIATVTLGAYID